MVHESKGRVVRHVLALEGLPHLCGAYLGAAVFGDVLDEAGEFDLQASRQIEPVLDLHDVRNTTLATLAVDSHNRFVAPADMFRVNRQVRDGPRLVILRAPA